jgi:hypothetical protein
VTSLVFAIIVTARLNKEYKIMAAAVKEQENQKLIMAGPSSSSA